MTLFTYEYIWLKTFVQKSFVYTCFITLLSHNTSACFPHSNLAQFSHASAISNLS